MSVLLALDKPENFQFAASRGTVCKDEVISFTCSAGGKPAVDTYQLLENDMLVSDGSNSHGMWNRTMSVGGVFIYKCVANNTVGTGDSERITVFVNGKQDTCSLLLMLMHVHVPLFRDLISHIRLDTQVHDSAWV